MHHTGSDAGYADGLGALQHCADVHIPKTKWEGGGQGRRGRGWGIKLLECPAAIKLSNGPDIIRIPSYSTHFFLYALAQFCAL